MLRRVSRVLGGTALLASCLALAADLAVVGPAASSSGTTFADPAGDVVGHAYVQDGQPPVRRTPRLTKPDVTSTRIVYTRDTLTIRAQARQPVRGIILSLEIHAPDLDLDVIGYPGDRAAFSDTRAAAEVRDVPQPPRECRAKDAVTADAEGGYYQWVLPSSCFGAPDAIRVGLLVSHQDISGSRGFVSYDDAFRTGAGRGSDQVQLTPPIRRRG